MEQMCWYAVARTDDIAPRHVFQAQLNGVELAIWRADDGRVNAWENRCPHRSVRFSLGVNTGKTLHCQYHGWQYRSGDGRCVLIPASPDADPPATLCAHAFAVTEAHQYVWVNLHARTDTQALPSLPFTPLDVPLRSIAIDAGIDVVRAALRFYADLDADAIPGSARATALDGGALELGWDTNAGEPRRIRFGLQPAHDDKTIVHASADQSQLAGESAARWHNQRLTVLRRRVEESLPPVQRASGAARATRYTPLQPVAGTACSQARSALISTTVTVRTQVAKDIVSLHLAIPADRAVEFTAGAHIDVHTPSGAVRQYSLVNAPGERQQLIIGVKNEPQSRGGSRSIHEQLHVGDRVTVSVPRNHFALSGARGALLIAGGIGITPIVAMAQQMSAQARPCELHYFARSAAHVAFRDRLDALPDVRLHLGLDASLTQRIVEQIVGTLTTGSDLYVCGPQPLIDCVRACADALQVDPSRVHAEVFSNAAVDSSRDHAFRVRLRNSGSELTVPAGVSLAAVLNAAGHTVDTSCEQGVCGTCRIGVVDGTPEHRDVYLTLAEQASGRCMMPCVSRSRSELLVLDL